jgi:hypothetical protein
MPPASNDLKPTKDGAAGGPQPVNGVPKIGGAN